MDENPQVGTESACTMCGAPIVFVGPYWDHIGENKPRHPATPGLGQAAKQVKHWIDGYEDRMRKHIQFALKYADDFNHGAPGHLDLLTIATLARQLSFALDQEPPRV